MSQNELSGPNAGSSGLDHKTLVIISYVLMIIGFGLVSLIIAYIKRSEAQGTLYASHWGNIISTFWIGLLAGIVAYVLALAITAGTLGFGAVIAWIPPLAVAIWWLYRMIKGLIYLNDGKAYA